MKTDRIEGLVAATVTPLNADGSLNLRVVPRLVDHLVSSGVSGLYACGSTGGGVSLTDDQRRAIAEAFINAANGRVKVIVQVGHNSLSAAAALAQHAAEVGADVISATCPSYFKIDCVRTLVDSMEPIAKAAPDTPFYYYHIPALTNVKLSMTEFLALGAKRIPNLVGIKYTEPLLHEYQECVEFNSGKFDILWGVDEMLLGALATGAQGAIGSTYNIAASLYHGIIRAFNEGDIQEARRLQSQANAMIRVMASYPFHASLKVALRLLDLDCGGCPLPQVNLSPKEEAELKSKLEAIGFFEFASSASAKQGVRVRNDGPTNGSPAATHATKSAADRFHERV